MIVHYIRELSFFGAQASPYPSGGARFALRNALHMENHVALAADRMKAMRERRRARGLRELRLIVPDAR
jgi:hypothetical protein